MAKRTGTKEWAQENVNYSKGCGHGCVYCYARDLALRFHRIKTGAEWVIEYPQRRWGTMPKYPGIVMLPSTHDLTPGNWTSGRKVLGKLLEAGNTVLIVTKPHEEIIKEILRDHHSERDRIIFRFTIGATTSEILTVWEPHAPSFEERHECLRLAHAAGFRTSVSAEPLLDPPHVKDLVAAVHPYVTETIWIGKLRQMRQRCKWYLTDHPEFEHHVKYLEQRQTDAWVKMVHEILTPITKIRWKDSYRKVLGLPNLEGAEI